MKKEKMNDKGFSLVELIIVIAIMAVLVVVLAPQYLKYVERSRNSSDISNATAMATALQVYAADPAADHPFKKGNVITITVTASGSATASSVTTTGTDADADAGKDALEQAAITIGDVHCKSKTNWTTYTITATVKSDGSLEFVYSSDSSESPDAFEAAMTK